MLPILLQLRLSLPRYQTLWGPEAVFIQQLTANSRPVSLNTGSFYLFWIYLYLWCPSMTVAYCPHIRSEFTDYPPPINVPLSGVKKLMQTSGWLALCSSHCDRQLLGARPGPHLEEPRWRHLHIFGEHSSFGLACNFSRHGHKEVRKEETNCGD